MSEKPFTVYWRSDLVDSYGSQFTAQGSGATVEAAAAAMRVNAKELSQSLKFRLEKELAVIQELQEL